MAFWTYILLCADGRYYTGHTDDLEKRVSEHQSGLTKGFTSSRLPVQLVWADYSPTRAEAIENELRVKKWSKGKKRALAAQDWEALAYFAKPPSERGVMPMGVSSSLDTNGEGVRHDGEEVPNSRESSLTPALFPFVSSEDETPIDHTKPISQKPLPK